MTPRNLNLPDEDPVNWDPEVIEQKLYIRDKEGLYNRLNELVKLEGIHICAEHIQQLLDKHFYFRGG